MIKLKKLFVFLTQERLVFTIPFLVFAILLFRNPYSQRTLIPNLEPYPDTFHYILPAINLSSGGPLKMEREGRYINPSVPPLYSIVLTPSYLINKDPRTFYFVNVVLSLLSLILFLKILKVITKDKWIIFLSLFLFSTNFYLYWYPQWAMAENLLLPIFLFGVFILVSSVNTKTIIMASTIPFLIYITKYAYSPLSLSYILIFGLKMFFDRGKRKKLKNIVLYLVLSFTFLSLALLIQTSIQHINPLTRYINILFGITPLKNYFSVGSEDKFVGATGWFSTLFLKKNLPLYLRGFWGYPERLLWDFTPILSRYLIVLSWVGLLISTLVKRLRPISLALLFMLLCQFISVASFSTFDMRYVYNSIPTFLLGVALFFEIIREKLGKKRLGKIFYIVIGGVFLFYSFTNIPRLRYQTILNLKYAETPWYYISVLKLNEYFTDEKVSGDDKPYVISPMAPYYIDYFSNGNYKVLPLNKDQEFRQNKKEAWGDEDYSDFHAIYEKYLLKGYKVYVSTYGLGNEVYLHKSFDDLYKDFNLVEVQDACYSQCKIYSLSIKK